MKILVLFLQFSACMAIAQTKDPAFAHMLHISLQHNVREIDVAQAETEGYYFLDCREKSEFRVSHLPNAIFIGSNPDKSTLMQVPKDKPWVLYCTVGVRSEKVTQLALNYQTERYNLLGGIFEWVNEGKPIVDGNGKPTERVHPYNRVWGVWLKAGTKSFE